MEAGPHTRRDNTHGGTIHVELKTPGGHPNIPPGKQAPLPRAQTSERSQARLLRSCGSRRYPERERTKERETDKEMEQEEEEGKENASKQYLRNNQQPNPDCCRETFADNGERNDDVNGASITPEDHKRDNGSQQLIPLPPKDEIKHTRRDTHGGTTHTAITTCVWVKEDTAVKGS